MIAPSSIGSHVRVVAALAGKDILDGIKNKTTLTNILIVFLVMIAYRTMPLWLDRDEPPRVIVYDAGDSTLVAAMDRDPGLRLIEAGSEAVYQELTGEGDHRELGLAIPAGYDEALRTGQAPALEATVVYWLNDREAQRLTGRVEEELSRLAGAPVQIEVQEARAYPAPKAGLAGMGPIMASLVLVLGLVMTGIGVAPHLMFDEKQERTLDMLLVSPARSGHVVLGKALAGLFYCLVAAVVILAFNARMIVRWELVLLVTFWGSLFAVSLGLLLGLVFETRQQYMPWGFGLMSILLLPVFLDLLAPLLPAAVAGIVRWLPTVALNRVAMASASPTASVTRLLPDLGVAAVCTIAILAAVVWRLRRSER